MSLECGHFFSCVPSASQVHLLGRSGLTNFMSAFCWSCGEEEEEEDAILADFFLMAGIGATGG